MTRVLLLLGVAASLAVAMERSAAAFLGEKHPSVVVVLFDLSSDTPDTMSTKNRYLNDFRRIADEMGFRDELFAGRITGNSFREAGFPVQGALDAKVLELKNDNQMMLAARLKKRKPVLVQRLVDDAGRLLDEPVSKTTDILGALNAAEQLFNNPAYANGFTKRLFVMSDMLQFTPPEYNFYKANLDQQETARILEREKSLNRLASLRGVEVQVIGPGGGSRERGLAVRDFWLRYFAEAGASVPNYGILMLRKND